MDLLGRRHMRAEDPDVLKKNTLMFGNAHIHIPFGFSFGLRNLADSCHDAKTKQKGGNIPRQAFAVGVEINARGTRCCLRENAPCGGPKVS